MTTTKTVRLQLGTVIRGAFVDKVNDVLALDIAVTELTGEQVSMVQDIVGEALTSVAIERLAELSALGALHEAMGHAERLDREGK